MNNLISTVTNYKRVVLAIALLSWMAFHAWLLNSSFGIDLTLSVWDSVVTNSLVVGFSILLSNTLLHYMPQSGKLWFAIVLSFALSWMCQLAIGQAMIQLTEDVGYIEFLNRSMLVRWAFNFIFIAGVSVSSLFYNQLCEQIELSQREATTAAMVKDAELRKLQLQLQPHFLFNCLNSINALILVRPEEGRKMVQNLSDFLRITIKRADEQWITFREEWNYIESYLEIEKIRFGHRLDVQAKLSESSYDWKMPTLLLQPLVENAIKFGLYGTTEKVTIHVETIVENQMLKIIITNPFDSGMQPQKGSGFGLTGMQRRLYLLFARNDLLETSMDENIFTVTIKLPTYYDQNTTH